MWQQLYVDLGVDKFKRGAGSWHHRLARADVSVPMFPLVSPCLILFNLSPCTKVSLSHGACKQQMKDVLTTNNEMASRCRWVQGNNQRHRQQPIKAIDLEFMCLRLRTKSLLWKLGTNTGIRRHSKQERPSAVSIRQTRQLSHRIKQKIFLQNFQSTLAQAPRHVSNMICLSTNTFF